MRFLRRKLFRLICPSLAPSPLRRGGSVILYRPSEIKLGFTLPLSVDSSIFFGESKNPIGESKSPFGTMAARTKSARKGTLFDVGSTNYEHKPEDLMFLYFVFKRTSNLLTILMLPGALPQGIPSGTLRGESY